MAISNPDVGPFDADAVFQPRRSQWESAPTTDKHVVSHPEAQPYDVGPGRHVRSPHRRLRRPALHHTRRRPEIMTRPSADDYVGPCLATAHRHRTRRSTAWTHPPSRRRSAATTGRNYPTNDGTPGRCFGAFPPPRGSPTTPTQETER